MKCDLHTHSNLSDGSLTPTELVRLAAEHVGVLALTDHDTTAGLAEASAEAQRCGLTFVPGIELSVYEQEGRVQCHVLGYGFDVESPALRACTERLRTGRMDRARAMVEKLAGLGFDLGADFLAGELDGEGTIGRPHVAQRLVQLGHCRVPQEAFDRFIGRGKPAFVPMPEFSAAQAIALVREARGVAVLAHGMRSTGIDCPGGAPAFIGRLAKQGLDGIEVQHPAHTKPQRRKLARVAQDLGLLQTGGSDFHGAAQPDVLLGCGRGDIRVERQVWDRLREALEARRN